jgi:hypothetical protein
MQAAERCRAAVASATLNGRGLYFYNKITKIKRVKLKTRKLINYTKDLALAPSGLDINLRKITVALFGHRNGKTGVRISIDHSSSDTANTVLCADTVKVRVQHRGHAWRGPVEVDFSIDNAMFRVGLNFHGLYKMRELGVQVSHCINAQYIIDIS